MKVEQCPVCNGTGSVPVGFYDTEGLNYTIQIPEICRSCSGRGYVYVPEEDEYAMFGILDVSS